MTNADIKSKFTQAQIDTFNANAKSQGAESFDKAIQTALDYEANSGLKNKALGIVTFAMENVGQNNTPTTEAYFSSEENEDLKTYS